MSSLSLSASDTKLLGELPFAGKTGAVRVGRRIDLEMSSPGGFFREMDDLGREKVEGELIEGVEEFCGCILRIVVMERRYESREEVHHDLSGQ